MKKLEMIIRPSRLDAVKEKLAAVGVHGMTCTRAQGFGLRPGHTETYRGASYEVDFVPSVRIEVVIHDEALERVLEAAMEAARTGEVGDGKIFLLPVENAWRIRSGESGDSAL